MHAPKRLESLEGEEEVGPVLSSEMVKKKWWGAKDDADSD
jgi:hypothetical protein